MITFAKIILPFHQLGRFWQQKINGQIFRLNLLIVTIQLSLLLFKFKTLPFQVPLFYSLPWGQSQLTTVDNLFLLPIFSALIMFLNNFLAALCQHQSVLLSRLLTIFSLLFSFLCLFTLINIILVIT